MGKYFVLWNKYPVKSVSLRLILIYHFASVARKQDTGNVRWLSQYVECSKPVNPFGSGICVVVFMVKSNETHKKKETNLQVYL